MENRRDAFAKLMEDTHWAIRYRKEPPGWRLAYRPQTGDCDSFAWSLAQDALKAGMRPEIVTVKLPDGQDHALVRIIDGGKYVYGDAVFNKLSDDAPGTDLFPYPADRWEQLRAVVR